MSLLAEGLATNQEKSLSLWLDTHLVGTEGLTLFYASSIIATRPLTPWVHADYLLGMRRQFGRQIGRRAVGGTSFGSRVHGFLNLNLCQQRVSLTRLPGNVQEWVSSGSLAPRTATLLARIPDPAAMEQAIKDVVFQHHTNEMKSIESQCLYTPKN